MVAALTRLCFVVVAFLGAGVLRAELLAVRSVGSAQVSRVAATAVADLILLDAGYDSGLRQGMVCTVFRSGENIGELLLVDLRSGSSTALILEVSPGLSLQSGDYVAVKTISSRK